MSAERKESVARSGETRVINAPDGKSPHAKPKKAPAKPKKAPAKTATETPETPAE